MQTTPPWFLMTLVILLSGCGPSSSCASYATVGDASNMVGDARGLTFNADAGLAQNAGDPRNAACAHAAEPAAYRLEDSAEVLDGSALGRNVVLSSDGSMALVSTRLDAATRGGLEPAEVVVYQRSGQQWFSNQRLRAPYRAFAFGASMAISGDKRTVVIGDWTADRVLFFTNTNDRWSDAEELARPANTVRFGENVAISEDGQTLAVSIVRPNIDSQPTPNAVAVYTRRDLAWGTPTLVNGPRDRRSFAVAMALSANGNVLVAGSPDAGTEGVFVFERTENAWQMTPPVSKPAATITYGGTVAVSARGDVLLVGDSAGWMPSERGGVYWYARTSTGWSAPHTLSVPAPDPALGRMIDLSADGCTIVIGDIRSRVTWLFARRGESFGAASRLEAPNARYGHFGDALAISADGSTLAISDSETDRGRLFFFRR